MEEERRRIQHGQGRFLTGGSRERRLVRWLKITLLLIWDGMLLYMIVACLIEPVYGAAFVAVVSVYLGYQL